MGLDQHASFGSSTSCAPVKSPASDPESEFEGDSVFDNVDVRSLDLSEEKQVKSMQDNDPSASESNVLPHQDLVEVVDLTQEEAAPVSESDSANQDSVPSEEEPESPYTVTFTIPSPPPPINGARNDPPLFWTHKLYRGPQDQPVKVHYCTDFDAAETLAKQFLGEKVVGFDMEWEASSTAKSPIKKQISVIQVAAEAKIAIFHIAQFQGGNSAKELIPPSLSALIESPEIMKTGVGVHSADGTRIKKVLRLEPKGLVELSHFFHVLQDNRNADGSYSKRTKAMADQVETYLKYALPKGKVRTSSWSSPLNFHQIDYAAADAYAGLMLYHVMNEKRKMLRPTPPHPPFAEGGSSVPVSKEKLSDAKGNGLSSVDVTVMANAATESAAELAEAPGPNAAGLTGPEAGKTQEETEASQKAAKEASEHLLKVLSPSKPCLEGWRVLFTGGFTCLTRDQLATLVDRCGAKLVTGTLVELGPDVLGVFGARKSKSKKRQILWDHLSPAMSETDFYNMIRYRDLVDYPPIEKPASWQGKSLDTVLYEVVEAACETYSSNKLYGNSMAAGIERASAWIIGAICDAEQKPRTVIELKNIDGGLFLYTFLKHHGYDLIQIIHAFNTPLNQEDLPRQGLATESL